MMKIDVTREDQGMANIWPLSNFNQAYDEKDGVRKVVMLSLSSQYGNPDKTAVLIFRLFIENSERLKEGQKYVLALRFYNFGDLVTLDLISLNKAYHRNMASEHILKMNWPPIQEGSDDLERVYHSPFLFVGAFVQLKDESFIFSSKSQDYGSSVFFADCNEIATYLSSLCNLAVSNDKDKVEGKNFLDKILQFILKNKGQNNFYEKFVTNILENQKGAEGFSSQQISSLLYMKAIDRSLKEKKPFFQIIVDEMSGGFSRNLMLQSITKRLR